ncbi:MAG: hypothetical protein ACFCD0_02825 [Gemmataceae bacterium]
MLSTRKGLGVGLLVVIFTPSMQAEEHYYFLLFTAQSEPKIPRLTHTFATAIKVQHDPKTNKCTHFVASTISWLPASLIIRPWALRAEKGHNFTLKETLCNSLKTQRVSMYGPFEIPAWFYRRFVRQVVHLDGNSVLYRAVDPYFNPKISDCMHGVTDIIPGRGRIEYPHIYYGDLSGPRIMEKLYHKQIILSSGDHSWLLPLLKLDRYPLIRRTYCPKCKKVRPALESS